MPSLRDMERYNLDPQLYALYSRTHRVPTVLLYPQANLSAVPAQDSSYASSICVRVFHHHLELGLLLFTTQLYAVGISATTTLYVSPKSLS